MAVAETPGGGSEFVRDPDAVSTRVVDGVIVAQPRTGERVHLDAVCCVLWQRLERPATLEAVIEPLVQRFDVDPDRAGSDAQAFLRSMIQRGLVTEHAGITG